MAKATLTGDFSGHLGKVVGLRAFAHPSRPFLDKADNEVLLGASAIKLDRNQAFEIQLEADPTLQWEIRTSYTVPGVGVDTWESGWFYLPEDGGDLTDLASDATAEPVTPTEGEHLQAQINTVSETANFAVGLAGEVQFTLGTKADLNHSHIINDVEGLQDALDNAGGGGDGTPEILRVPYNNADYAEELEAAPNSSLVIATEDGVLIFKNAAGQMDPVPTTASLDPVFDYIINAKQDKLPEPVDGKLLGVEGGQYSLVDPTEGGGGGPVDWDDVTNKPTEFPPSTHVHEIADVNGLDDRLVAAEEYLAGLDSALSYAASKAIATEIATNNLIAAIGNPDTDFLAIYNEELDF